MNERAVASESTVPVERAVATERTVMPERHIDRRVIARALVDHILLDAEPEPLPDLVATLIVGLAPFATVPSILKERPYP